MDRPRIQDLPDFALVGLVGVFRQPPDAPTTTLRPHPILGEDGAKVRKTFGEWASDNGRGYLCASVDLS